MDGGRGLVLQGQDVMKRNANTSCPVCWLALACFTATLAACGDTSSGPPTIPTKSAAPTSFVVFRDHHLRVSKLDSPTAIQAVGFAGV